MDGVTPVLASNAVQTTVTRVSTVQVALLVGQEESALNMCNEKGC